MPVKTVSSVEKALRVLEAVAEAQPVGVSELARTLGIDKNAVQRALITLGEAGWLRRSPADPGQWELTSRVLRLGQRVAPDLRDVARPHLEALQGVTEETALLWQRSGDQFVLLDEVQSPHPLRMTVAIGTTVPIDGIAASLLPERDRVRRRTRSSVDPAVEALFRRRGWFPIDRQYPNSVAIAAPFVVARTGLLASVVLVGPRSRMPRAAYRELGERTAEAARAIATTA